MSSECLSSNEIWMARALALAGQAAAIGEVPVGAVVVETSDVEAGGTASLISEAYNRREIDHLPTAHAELKALELASQKLGRWRLTGCTLYVTLEPCVMCAGAIVLSRVDRVVYGALDPKAGACESLFQILSDTRLNHRPEVIGGVLASECSRQLSEFFARRRAELKSKKTE